MEYCSVYTYVCVCVYNIIPRVPSERTVVVVVIVISSSRPSRCLVCARESARAPDQSASAARFSALIPTVGRVFPKHPDFQLYLGPPSVRERVAERRPRKKNI